MTGRFRAMFLLTILCVSGSANSHAADFSYELCGFARASNGELEVTALATEGSSRCGSDVLKVSAPHELSLSDSPVCLQFHDFLNGRVLGKGMLYRQGLESLQGRMAVKVCGELRSGSGVNSLLLANGKSLRLLGVSAQDLSRAEGASQVCVYSNRLPQRQRIRVKKLEPVRSTERPTYPPSPSPRPSPHAPDPGGEGERPEREHDSGTSVGN